jgi:hypothetical protein
LRFASRNTYPEEWGKVALSDGNTSSTAFKQRVEQDGFAIVPTCLDEATVELLNKQFDDTRYPERNLLSVPSVRALAISRPVREIMEAVLGPECVAVRGIFFNKTRSSNWKVVWHQDLTIAVRERADVSGFGPWTTKAGILHVHRKGRLSAEQIGSWNKETAVTCTVPQSGALVMRPLVLHASASCAILKARRVIHLEFAATELPHGLEWHDRISLRS